VIAAALLSGCAASGPRGVDHAERLAQVDRLVAQRCDAHAAASLGLEVATLADFAPEARDRAARLGIGEAPQVVAIRAGSDAHAAGIRIGDVIESIDGQAVGTESGAAGRFVAAGAAGGHDLRLQVRRDGTVLEIRVGQRRPCTRSV
jgi:S1-C subfamily serine protease